ncbi:MULTISPECIES: flagellar basal body P-ring protein FlgI [Vibrio]|uniref:Flagellar P-ring protein n=10 Tax=Vibrio harveyi group TaxID=717610 RepID=A0AA36UMN4_VIBAL|nr:flagellar basal body P-ring protein FlgI [Vibrio alginolyticus]NAW54104.1 flagellar basal body P-ring protein FlgI [Vibrio sp. V41_P2S12T139]NAW93690.1 flagellar basal body P-ring protein FlgI [Vibrio sp. V42_P2S4T144]NNN38526.1 flagellar basal body P-ring protein FlgI [Vibrio sp. 2-2(2)]NNN49988.1 flagellar basal body P-ring protein FlgI [Vibrio sp. 2-2(7)]NNN64030.1 flagellar basal body P-ring protein FlgI [Vibrio sp. 2-1(7)]NNN86095.1 flagellar basal body P-ring protein FlgI [Vibrio sp.
MGTFLMKTMQSFFMSLLLVLTLGLPGTSRAEAEIPIMDLVDVRGIRENQLVGYGLVVGLAGQGDRNQVKFTSQSITNMLRQFGVQIDDSMNPKLRNVASVSVTASVDPMAGPGQTLDVVVSSIGDAKSLRGGTLLLTPLRGIDGEVYAIAQGNVVVGGLSAEGRSGSKVEVNTPTAGRVPNGATLEREIKTDFNQRDEITLNLRKPSFTTAKNIAREINNTFGPNVAVAINKARIDMRAPKDTQQRVVMMSMLEEMSVVEGRKPARIVFNSRTGTVVIGKSVKVSEAAVSHGNLTVRISESQQVSQPNAFANGDTKVVNQTDLDVNEDLAQMVIWPPGTELNTIVNAVNSLGATPTDLMSILQALSEAGALNAELVVI